MRGKEAKGVDCEYTLPSQPNRVINLVEGHLKKLNKQKKILAQRISPQFFRFAWRYDFYSDILNFFIGKVEN